MTTNAAPLLSGATITVGFENQVYINNLFTVVTNDSNKNPCGNPGDTAFTPYSCIVYGDTGSCSNGTAVLIENASKNTATTNFVIKALTYNTITSSYDFMADGTAIQYGMYVGIYQVNGTIYNGWHIDSPNYNALTLFNKASTTIDGTHTDIRYQVWVLADPDNPVPEPAKTSDTHYQGIYVSAADYGTYPYNGNKPLFYGSTCIFQSVGKKDISNTGDYYFIDNQNSCHLTVDNFNSYTHQPYKSMNDILTFFVLLNGNGVITNNDGTITVAPTNTYYSAGGQGTQSLPNNNSTNKPAGYTPSNNGTNGIIPNLTSSDQLKYDNKSASTADDLKQGLFIYVIIIIVLLALLLLYHIYTTAQRSKKEEQLKQLKEEKEINTPSNKHHIF